MEFLDHRHVKQLLSGHTDALLGVSGGIDSMVLLHWFAQNRDHLGCHFRVMHVNHGEPLAAQWAEFTREACRQLQVNCIVENVTLEGLGNNFEHAARQARYRALCKAGSDVIVLAHHANDQAENFFLKLFRGSGIKGLKSMGHKVPCWYDEKISVVRPLLNITRRQIADWAELNNVPVIDDPSNNDTKLDRNYIRHRVWPVIQQRFDIADINIARSIGHITEAYELTNMLADQDLALVSNQDGSLDWSKVRDLGYLRIKNLLLRVLDREGVYSFSVGHIEQFAKGLVDADMDSKNELHLRGFSINKIGKRIHVGKNQRRAA